jgi:hypothetical protein
MDPGTYISIAGATIQAIQLCGLLKDALQGHEESKHRLDELEHVVKTVRRNFADDAEAPPTLRGILDDLEKFHREYKSAGLPGRRIGQVANRIRLVFSDDNLKKKYDRLMVHMTSEIYS